jgi:hypothetical protein
MNKVRKFIKEQPASLITLGAVITAALLFGLILSFWVMIDTITEKNLNSLPWCFSSSCLEHFFNETNQVYVIIKATLDSAVAIATIGGIFVALLSYFATASNYALTNHIEHLKVFTEYLDTEIKKRDRLSPPLIDTLYFYCSIFTQSRSGKTTVSDTYEKFINELNAIIHESNQRCVAGTPGGFSYNDHQRKIRDHLASIGITVHIAPRNDYLEMEGQLFSLLHRVNQSFCTPGALPEMQKRTYY